ncbi:MAG: helix-turn-helix domain-containing protein [Bacilli bacterium]|nr:helix-turn-helix domain-containing protein [Bacilli bacterium]
MNKLIRTEAIANNIRKLRLGRHLSQVELGDLLGYSMRQIRRLETNGTTSIEVVNRIAIALGVSAKDILFR